MYTNPRVGDQPPPNSWRTGREVIKCEGPKTRLLSTTFRDGLVGDQLRSTTSEISGPEYKDIVEHTPFVCDDKPGLIVQQEVIVAGHTTGQTDDQPVQTPMMKEDDVMMTILSGLDDKPAEPSSGEYYHQSTGNYLITNDITVASIDVPAHTPVSEHEEIHRAASCPPPDITPVPIPTLPEEGSVMENDILQQQGPSQSQARVKDVTRRTDD